MGYFESVANNSFKEEPGGKIIFYPNGPFGKGRVIPDEKTKLELLKFQKRQLKLSYIVGIPYCFILTLVGIFTINTLAPILLLFLYLLFKQHLIIRDFEKHNKKLSFKEVAQQGIDEMPNWSFWFLGIISAFSILFHIYLFVFCNNPFMDVLGSLSLGLLGLAVSIKLYII